MLKKSISYGRSVATSNKAQTTAFAGLSFGASSSADQALKMTQGVIRYTKDNGIFDLRQL